MENKPVILIVNDDGYEAKGLKAMVEIAKDFGEVYVVTPDSARSGMAHAITIGTPLRLKKYHQEEGVEYWRTNGTPVDCVKLGQRVLLKDRKIDLVLSGINHGSNSSASVIYSGTMAGAIEASFEYPAIGISLLDYAPDADFSASIHYGKMIVEKVLKEGLPEHVCLNVNVPVLPIEQIKGIKVTRQTKGYWEEEFVEQSDPYGGKCYWLSGHLVDIDHKEDSCQWALDNGYISVQPVQYDLTAYSALNNIKYLEDEFKR